MYKKGRCRKSVLPFYDFETLLIVKLGNFNCISDELKISQF